MRQIIKIIFAFIFVALFIPEPVYSCNGGCPSGGGYLVIVPQFTKNFIGLRYRLRSFSYLNTSMAGATETQHQFETTELWGRFYPAKKIQAFVFLPFQMNGKVFYPLKVHSTLYREPKCLLYNYNPAF